MNPLRTAVNSFLAAHDGNFAVMTAAVSAALVLAAGFALNIGQVTMTRSNLLNALDAAVTSTARDITTGRLAPDQARETVEAFLIANGGTGFADADNITLDSLTADRAARTLRAVASVNIELAFPVFGTASTRTISVESAAVYSDKKIEVAMMLDVTGSMAGRKLADLKKRRPQCGRDAARFQQQNQSPRSRRSGSLRHGGQHWSSVKYGSCRKTPDGRRAAAPRCARCGRGWRRLRWLRDRTQGLAAVHRRLAL